MVHHDVRPGSGTAELATLLGQVDQLLAKLDAAESQWRELLDSVHRDYRCSARNLVHYWAIRQLDLRGLQARLAEFGLSSLGRSESHVQSALLLVRSAIVAMLEDAWEPPVRGAVSVEEGRELLRRRAVELLGPPAAGRDARIMVTLPSTAAGDPELIRTLIGRGMNLARINCAHDDEDAWRSMTGHVRRAAAETGRPCLVAMDLGGPKLRTGPLEPGPRVVKIRPVRDERGRVTAPATVWLTAAESPTPAPRSPMTTVPVPGEWLRRRRTGEVLALRDARDAHRRFTVASADPNGAGVTATAEQTSYLCTGTELHAGGGDTAEVAELPAREQSLLLRPGDLLDLTRDCAPAPVAADAAVPRIGCTLAEVFTHGRVGEPILFDDGQIGGQIIDVTPERLRVRITRAAAGGSRLRAAKGINVPETRLRVRALTGDDVADLTTVVDVADVVEMSFVQEPADVAALHEQLDRLGADHLGVVLKIETRRAFEQLPVLLLTAMRRPRVGVMIARGDLAVECGYQRLAELQEEILWLCEAAHLPVIWATQVLEQLAKVGLPSRAEISDAAMSERAECVMLNKGPHIAEAVTVLDDILGRMAEHHYKKNALLRQLHSWLPAPR